ncbi:MAG: DUF4832 domain-containing protein [Verrucomicrobiales bacterium]
MIHLIRFPLLCYLLLAWCCTWEVVETSAEAELIIKVVKPPFDPGKILHNPDMGWILYENYPLDQNTQGSSTLLTLPHEDFPEVDAVALMFSWADVEQEEGEYDYSKVDYAYDYWKKRGKDIQLRLSAESLLWWEKANPPSGKGVPDYLLKQLPASAKQVRLMEGLPYTNVDARHRLYRERLRLFLSDVAKHFSGKRNVTLVDLRGFGLWGEWHSGFQYKDNQARRKGLKAILDDWTAAFPHHWLSLSYSYDPDGPKVLYSGSYEKYLEEETGYYAQFLEFSAFDYALTKTNISWRRDGCGGAVHSNERKLNKTVYEGKNRGPLVSEFAGGYLNSKKGGQEWLEFMIDDALSLHPNYINLLGWQGGDALAFIKGEPELFKKGSLRMGYRLRPVEVRHNPTVAAGKRMNVEVSWINEGVGRALKDFQVEFAIRRKGDSNIEGLTWLGRFQAPTSQWLEGDVCKIKNDFLIPDNLEGEFELIFRMVDTITDRRIALPLINGTQEGYCLTEFTISMDK